MLFLILFLLVFTACSSAFQNETGFAKPLEDMKDICGIRPGSKPDKVSLKIIGGREAKPNSWPWLVSLIFSYDSETRYRTCAGSLISQKWVMTAAHCLSSNARNKPLTVGRFFNIQDEFGKSMFVRLGDHKSYSIEVNEIDVPVKSAIIHPGYLRNSAEHGNDLALLELEEPVEFNSQVSPVCLPDRSLRLPAGYNCYVAGWGRVGQTRIEALLTTSILDILFYLFSTRPTCDPNDVGCIANGEQSNTLLEAQLPLVSLKQCREIFVHTKEWVHVCAGIYGKDSCPGDSGGGLYCMNPADQRWYLYGVTSFGAPYGCGKIFSVYACARGAFDWVQKTISLKNE